MTEYLETVDTCRVVEFNPVLGEWWCESEDGELLPVKPGDAPAIISVGDTVTIRGLSDGQYWIISSVAIVNQ